MDTINMPKYNVELARALRRRQTPAEEALWVCLRNRRLGVKFRRQHLLGRYIADFYCHESGLVVELDGGVHDRSGQKEYDLIRQEVMEQQSLEVLRFNNEQVIQDLESVIADITGALITTSQPLSLRERGQG